MLILSIHCIKCSLIPDKWFFTEISTTSQITACISGTLKLLFCSHFLFKLQPLSLKFHNFLTILLLLNLKLIFFVLNSLLKVTNHTFIFLQLLPNLFIFRLSFGKQVSIITHFTAHFDKFRVELKAFMFLGF